MVKNADFKIQSPDLLNLVPISESRAQTCAFIFLGCTAGQGSCGTEDRLVRNKREPLRNLMRVSHHKWGQLELREWQWGIEKRQVGSRDKSI